MKKKNVLLNVTTGSFFIFCSRVPNFYIFFLVLCKFDSLAYSLMTDNNKGLKTFINVISDLKVIHLSYIKF